MIRTLQDHGIHQGMAVYMECTIYSLLKDGDRIRGALGYWRESGRFVVFKAKAIVLATGGVGKALPHYQQFLAVYRRRLRHGL